MCQIDIVIENVLLMFFCVVAADRLDSTLLSLLPEEIFSDFSTLAPLYRLVKFNLDNHELRV